MTTLSNLPDDILDHIFSYINLTILDLIQLSLVSKQFFSILQKHPALVYDVNRPHPEMQLKSMISTLNRYKQHKIPLKKFTFELIQYLSISNATSQCIQLVAAQRGLTYLSLKYVYMIDAFANIIRGCPSIETLVMEECRGDFQLEYLSALKNLHTLNIKLESDSILNFPQLKQLAVWNVHNKIKVSSPCLEHISYYYQDDKMTVYDHYQPEAHFDTPKLAVFCFNWYLLPDENFFGEIPKLVVKGNSSGWISHISLHFPMEVIPSSWLRRVNTFLKSYSAEFRGSKTASLTLVLNYTVVPKADELIHPEILPGGIQDLVIESIGARFCLSSARAILNGIFFICRPKRVRFCCSFLKHETPQRFKYDIVKSSMMDHGGITEVLEDYKNIYEDSFDVVFNLEYSFD